jgi:hypothetical protein
LLWVLDFCLSDNIHFFFPEIKLFCLISG